MLKNFILDSELHRHFEIDVQGHPLAINEFSTWLAEDANTHVIQFNDNCTFEDVYVEEFGKNIQFIDQNPHDESITMPKMTSKILSDE